MLIENQESLKGWLTSILEPMCDADPNALAKYVIALVKKDKPQPELKETCIDQLDVFLQEETKPFVELLFQALETKSYIKKPEPTPLSVTSSVPSSTQAELPNASANTANNVLHTSPVRLASNAVGNNVRDAKDVRESRRPSRIDGIADTDERDGKRIVGRRSLSRSRSRSRSSRSRSRNRSRSRSRERDDRRPRRYNDDKRDRRGPVRRYERYNEYRRDRSRDRDRSREHERDGERIRERERTSRSRSRSRSKTRSRSRERDRPRPESREANHKSSSPTTTEHGDTDYRYSAAPSTVPIAAIPPPPIASVPVPVTSEASALFPFNRNKPTRRCRDFDEMGYCMRGDLCPYDHGTDPVVVEDVNIPNMMAFGPPSSQGPPAATAPIPSILGPPMLRPPLPQGPPPHTPVSRPAEQQHIRNESFPHYSEPYIPEPYNPEAPSLERPPRLRTPYWMPRPGAPRGVGLRPAPPFQQPMARELISVPTLDDVTHLDSSQQPQKNRTVVAPQKRAIDEVSKENIVEVRQHEGPNNSEIPNKRRLFDFNRLGPRKNINLDNSTLELRKIPRGLNSITQLNNHFSKFGKIVNLQVCYEGNPEAALLTFSTHAEANAAYRSTEAVLNNRFIKVFWHNKENTVENNSKREVRAEVPSKKTSVKDRLGDPVTKPNSVSNSAPSGDDVEKTSVVLSPSGNLSKTVFNPAALKKNNVISTPKTSPIVTLETVKKKQEEQRKEVLKINANLQKRKQEIFEKNIQDQKILIGKLEQKTLTPGEREKVLETLKSIQETINVVKKDFMPPVPMNQPKTKQEAEKELLDVEMDLYNKQHQGADTTELRKKVAELKKEATALGLLDSNKSHRGRGRGRGLRTIARGSYRGRGRGILPSTVSVDHRPRKVLISSLDEKDRIDVLAHLAQFGEIEGNEYDELNRAMVLTFKTRKDAEMFVSAVSRGPKLKEKSIHMSWFKDNATDQVNDAGDETLTDFVGEEELGEVEAVELLLADDEEEEDSEGRSWKR